MNAIFRDLGKALERNGVRCQKVDGWKDRGRPYDFEPRGVMFHHTASAKTGGNTPALGTVTNGRPDLEGPLCNFLVGRNGLVVFVAAGYANHAGEGGPHKGIPKNSGNKYLIGVECENNGLGEEWTEKQKDAIATLFAVLLRRMDRGSRMVIAHKEWTPRKPDPANINMDSFRDRVRTKLANLR